MRKPTALFWLWLVYSGLLTWQGLVVVHAQGRVNDDTPVPTVEGPTSSSDNNYNYQYDDTDFESVTDETLISPATTLKAGRNFGNRIRGINNNSPYNANSVNNNNNNNPSSSSSIVSNRYVDNVNNNNNYNNGGITTPPFLRPRPTSSSVISYNPTNYNRVVKRRKQQQQQQQNINDNQQPENATTLINSSNNYNRNNLSSNSFNNSALNRTRGVQQQQQQQQEVFTPLSQPTTSQNLNVSGLNKVIIRKRPRPVTVNDFLTTTTTTTPVLLKIGVDENNTDNNNSSTSPSPSSSFNIPQQNNNNNVSLRSRRVKVTSTVITSVPTTIQMNTNSQQQQLEAQPVSNVPVSVPKFEYNPSVAVKDGVYRFRYSEPMYSSKRVYSENFGVTRDTYGYGEDEDDGDDETTTYVPTPEGTTLPYQINIDGSEEEFTSSLPPVYREYLDHQHHQNGGGEEEQKQQKQQQSEENQQQAPPVDHQYVRNVLNAENKQGSVTVTITHTVTAATTTPSAIREANKSQIVQAAADNLIVGTKVAENNHNNNAIRRPTSSVKDENSHPNTIPVVADQFNSSSNHSGDSHIHQQHEEDHQQHLHLRPTPALPTYTLQPSTPSPPTPPPEVNQIFKNNSSSSSVLLNATDSISDHKSNNDNNVAQASNSSVTATNNSIVKLGAGANTDDGEDGHGHHIIDNASSSNSNITHDSSVDANNNGGDPNVPSPTISSKVLSSLYFTKDENPYYTTSSYSYGVTTEYSYYVPHENGGGGDDHDDHHDGHGHGDHKHGHHKDEDNSQKQQELRPTTTAYWDALGHKSTDILKSRHITNASSFADQELGYSTPEADTELPPLSSYGSDLATTPMPINVPAGTGDQDRDHSNVHDNEIDDDSGSSDDSSDDDGLVETPNKPPGAGGGRRGDKTKGGPGSSFNENDAELPSVPVFIQVLLDMPSTIFCSSVPRFKEMVVRVYAANAAQLEVTKEQVVVFNEPNCSNVTVRRNHTSRNNNSSGDSSGGSIRYATTTASVIRTVSSPARSVVPQRRNITGFTPASSTSSSPIPSTKPRSRRNDHRNSYHYHNSDAINGTGGSAQSEPTPTTTLYPVFFYLTDKNGTYNQNLTESFIEFWSSSKVTTDTMFFDKIKKVQMMSPTQGITGHATTNENSGIIAAITIASIAAVCLFLLGVLLLVMRHRQAASKFAKRCTPVSLDDYSLDNISVYNSFRRKQRNRASKRSYTNAAFDDPNAPSRPCNAAGLASIVRESQKLEDEFLDLPNVNPTMDDIPVGAETKNRYANVIPVPDTRVLLTFQEDVPNSDYINANFVRGPMGTSKGYVITQGPLDDTIVDFWRLVWEQQIRVIMMLTDFSEAGIPKCSEYYPRSETVDSSQLHGDYQITLEKRDIAENCITSYLVIKDMERNLRRDVIHLWYHSWPEKGVPSSPKLTVDFLVKSRKFTKEPTPVLVHCSPGTGRSGTLVACDTCIRELETQQTVNIPRTVMKIRQDRAGSVQTKEQYLHIYDVVHYYASRLGSQLDSI